MGENVVFSTQQTLDFFGIAIKLDPLLVGGLCNPVSSNASFLQPVAHCRNGILCRGKEVIDLMDIQIFAVVGRAGVGAAFKLDKACSKKKKRV